MTGEEWLDSAVASRPPEASAPPSSLRAIPDVNRSFTAEETEELCDEVRRRVKPVSSERPPEAPAPPCDLLEEYQPPELTDSDDEDEQHLKGRFPEIVHNLVNEKDDRKLYNSSEEISEDIEELTAWITGTVNDLPATTAMTRNQRRRCPQRAASQTKILPEFAPLHAGRWKKKNNDINDRVVARDPRPTVQLCERESNEVMMAANEVPEFLLHSEVLDSGCEVHIADETDFPGYEVKPTEDSRNNRGFRVADGKVIPNKGEATPQFEVDGLQGRVHALTSTFQVAKVSKPLRSVSMICDAGFDVLFTKTEALVRDPQGLVVCTCPRAGGLYKGEMRFRNPLHQGFRRQGQ